MLTNPTSTPIRTMFDGLSPRYDAFNRCVSMGMDAIWRRHTLRPVRPGMRILDVGTGTGDLALGAARLIKGKGEVIGLDFSEPMIAIARQKQAQAGFADTSLRWVVKKAEDIPFEAAPYDGVVSGFVLRNIAQAIQPIIAGIYASLKPGGFISFVDLTEPENAVVKRFGFLYLNLIVRLWGRFFFGASYPENYLRDSMSRFLKRSEFAGFLREAGFTDVRTRTFMLGMVTHYSARKPA